MNYEILKWDTEFFNFLVCKINASDSEFSDYKLVLKEIYLKKVALAYYSSDIPMENEKLFSELFEANLVDKKTTYIKKVNSEIRPQYNIQTYDEVFPNNKLFELAIESGKHSRFYIDKKIDKSKAEELYRQWIINSVNKKIAKETLVYFINEQIVGFVTLNNTDDCGNIGIIAVDKNYRGKGIGKNLMMAAEAWFAGIGMNNIQVTTQEDNKEACKLYESCDFKIKKLEFFYHLWRK